MSARIPSAVCKVAAAALVVSAALPAGVAPSTSAAIVAVSPANDAVVTTDPDLAYVYDTTGESPQITDWYIRFSSRPEIGADGILADNSLRFGIDNRSDPLGAGRWVQDRDQRVPTRPGVVYWQPYGASGSGCQDAACSTFGPTGIVPGPVTKVTILPEAVVVRIAQNTPKTFTVERQVPYLRLSCSLDCTVTLRTSVSARGKRRADLDFAWPDLQIGQAKGSGPIRPRISSSLRARIRAAMGARGTARLVTIATARDVFGRTATAKTTLTFKRRTRRARTPSSSVPTLTEQAEAAARRALKERNLLYSLGRCDRVGNAVFDCIARPLGGADIPDRRARVRRQDGRWLVGAFEPIV